MSSLTFPPRRVVVDCPVCSYEAIISYNLDGSSRLTCGRCGFVLDGVPHAFDR